MTGRVVEDPCQLSLEPPPATTPGTLAGRYAAWRATEEGHAVFAGVEAMALDLAARGERRIEINALCAAMRHQHHRNVNNSFRALLGRELVAKHPHLDPLIERRRRLTP